MAYSVLHYSGGIHGPRRRLSALVRDTESFLRYSTTGAEELEGGDETGHGRGRVCDNNVTVTVTTFTFNWKHGPPKYLNTKGARSLVD